MDLDSELRALPGYGHVGATCAGCCSSRAAESERLAALKGSDPIYHPPSNDSVLHFARVGKVFLGFAQRQFVPAAEMEYVGDVKRRQRPISAKTKTRHVYCALATQTAAIQQVAGVS